MSASEDLAPCCSNLSWLINKLYTSQQISANVYRPSFLIIDDSNLFITVSCRGAFILLNQSTLDIIQSTLIVSNNTATSLSYITGFYYIPSWNSTLCNIDVFSTKNLSSIANITLSNTVTRCGRLWLAITGYDIQIFDPWGHSLLYKWSVTTNVNGILLLLVTDYSLGQILPFNPNIEQCTS